MIYLISGLGADERVFSRINFEKQNTVFLPWIVPHEQETLHDYLARFSAGINRNDEIILFGVSFGGIVAIELSKLLPVKKIIVVSSVKTVDEFSLLLKFPRFTRLNKLFPASGLKKHFRFLAHYFFGCRTEEERKGLDDMAAQSDPRIINWSVEMMLNWQNRTVPGNLFHIHGTKDRIFPFRYLHGAIPVEGGTHFMIVNRAEEVSAIIQDILSKD